MFELSEPTNEQRKKVKSYVSMEMIDKEDFNFLAKIAARICGTQMSLISMIYDDRLKFLSGHGINVIDIPEDFSFCTYTFNKTDGLHIVKDASKDDNFKKDPLIVNPPHIKFYAGKSLLDDAGKPIGTLCVMDNSPKELDAEQIDLLESLSRQVMKLLESRKKQKETEQLNKELKKNNTILELTQKASKFGAWELDIETDTVIWSERVYEIHEIESDFEQNKNKALDFYPPKDRKRVKQALEKILENGEDFDIVNRLITAKGNEKWVRSTGRRLENKIVGSFQDITEIKKNELKYKAIFDSAFTFLGFIDAEGILFEVNKSPLELSNLKEEDVIGKPLWDCYWWKISKDTQQRL